MIAPRWLHKSMIQRQTASAAASSSLRHAGTHHAHVVILEIRRRDRCSIRFTSKSRNTVSQLFVYNGSSELGMKCQQTADSQGLNYLLARASKGDFGALL